MARGLHSLRQRSANTRNDENNSGTVLPMTMQQATNTNEVGTGRQQQRLRGGSSFGGNPQQQQQHLPISRRRRTKRSGPWERQLRSRIILTNLIVFAVLLGAIALVMHHRRNLSPFSQKNTIRSLFLPSRNGNTTPLQKSQNHKKLLVYDFVCKNHPDTKGMLNDDYCDCPDGSDEPGTSACSHLLVGKRVFSCEKNNNVWQSRDAAIIGLNSKGHWIFASRVKDGVIDCQNGADEKGNSGI